MRGLSTIFWLSAKELASFSRDWVLLGLVVYSFSLAVIAQAQSSSQELRNASIAIVDEDRSELSRRIARAFLPPYFKPVQEIEERDIDRLMNTGKYTFVIDLPPHLERDVLGKRGPALLVAVDATMPNPPTIMASDRPALLRMNWASPMAPPAPPRAGPLPAPHRAPPGPCAAIARSPRARPTAGPRSRRRRCHGRWAWTPPATPLALRRGPCHTRQERQRRAGAT